MSEPAYRITQVETVRGQKWTVTYARTTKRATDAVWMSAVGWVDSVGNFEDQVEDIFAV